MTGLHVSLHVVISVIVSNRVGNDLIGLRGRARIRATIRGLTLHRIRVRLWFDSGVELED